MRPSFRLPHVTLTVPIVRRWLTPGIGLKRWLVVVFVGETLLALAGALLLRQVYRDYDFSGSLGQSLLYVVTLQFLPYWVRGAIVGGIGVALFLYGLWRAVGVLMGPFLTGDQVQPLVEVIYQKRFLSRGPRIVVLGGGTGLSTMLRGLKEHSSNITAVVTVADDGGSSGRLREELGIPAVGDIRNCIAALADSEPLMTELLQYRFPGEAEASLGGHTIGNLLLAAMNAVQGDDFEEAVRQMNRVLAVRGQVVPATATPVVLNARLQDGTLMSGQSDIAKANRIERVWLTPDDVAASDDALRAIDESDLIVVGPGSLYTSIIPSVLLPQIADAIRRSPALRVYICNVATQKGETRNYDLVDHVSAIESHIGPGLIDVVLANNRFDARRREGYAAQPVKLRWPPAREAARPADAAVPRLVLDDVVDADNAHHHDPARLATALMRIYERESFGRRRSRISRTA
jgi:uncharacterized cofD-like protein